MTAEAKTKTAPNPPRLLTPQELGLLVLMMREVRGWSQEVLGQLSSLSVRTIQRVEAGEPSGLDTRRALARAFNAPDIDVFNKPMVVPTPEEITAAKKEADRLYVTLDATHATTGMELGLALRGIHGSLSHPATELSDEAARLFASLVDDLRDYTDLIDDLRETEKLDMYESLDQTLKALSGAGVSVCYSVRRMRVDKKLPIAILYVLAFEKGKEPEQFIAARNIEF